MTSELTNHRPLKYHKIILFIVVLIWDESQKDLEKKAVMDITFSQPVVNVRMKRDRLVYRVFVH